MMKLAMVLVVSLLAGACGGGGDDDVGSLPLEGGMDAPTVRSIELGCNGLTPRVTRVYISDAQGTQDVNGVVVRYFQDRDAGGTAIEQTVQHWENDEWSGPATAELTPLSDACAGSDWPVEVMVLDAEGHVTQGKVLASVAQEQ